MILKILVKNFIFIFILFYSFSAFSEQKILIEKQKILIEKQKILIEKQKKEIFYYFKKTKYLAELIDPLNSDINTKKNLLEIVFKKKNQSKIRDKKFQIYNPDKNIILRGIANIVPGSAYLDFYEDNLFLLSTIGIIGYAKVNDDELIFKQINNNIDDFFKMSQLKKDQRISTKDLKIFDNKVFVSFINEVRDNCWNVSVIFADLNYNELEFKEWFVPDECINSLKSEDIRFDPDVDRFDANITGGRIINLYDKFLILSVGEFRSRFLSQDVKSVFGKILKINIDSRNYEILTMGNRNPQGLYYDTNNDFILETEHGPQGGDEINLIKLNENTIQNYGWPIASYGEHYDGNPKEKIYQRYPLLKSHKENGFVEPLKSFQPAIGISEIVGLGDNNYVVSSMKDMSLYFFELNKKNQIENIERIEIGERIRDLIYNQNKIFLFLEDSASIGIIDWN